MSEIKILEEMNKDEFNEILQNGYDDAINNRGMDLDEAFERINNSIEK